MGFSYRIWIYKAALTETQGLPTILRNVSAEKFFEFMQFTLPERSDNSGDVEEKRLKAC